MHWTEGLFAAFVLVAFAIAVARTFNVGPAAGLKITPWRWVDRVLYASLFVYAGSRFLW